jgi:hypothetical protein
VPKVAQPVPEVGLADEGRAERAPKAAGLAAEGRAERAPKAAARPVPKAAIFDDVVAAEAEALPVPNEAPRPRRLAASPR